MRGFDFGPYRHQEEGQHFERKSLFEGPEGHKRQRDRKTVRDQVAAVVAGFANAEGGVLALGVEDDGTVTGHALPADVVEGLLQVPRSRLAPPQPPGFVVDVDGRAVLVFDVAPSDVPVQVIGDGFPLRIGDQTVQASESQIAALKFRGLAESWDASPSALTVDDLDRASLARAKAGAGLPDLSDAEYLLQRRLADRRGAGIALRRAAELLFAVHPDHPNAGVRVFRVLGVERRTGVDHNVEELARIEGNLPQVLASTFTALGAQIRRPSRLRGTRFEPTAEYPDFCWREAIVNAVAHRDYAVLGRGVEVWLFDDRMEVSSPGGLVADVALDVLRRGERQHVTRNPRLARPLVDLGVMREQGEGIPRMFAEMSGNFLPAPQIDAPERGFVVTLRNEPTLNADDRDFVARLGDLERNPLEFRALLEAHRSGRVDNERMRRIAGLEVLAASKLLTGLRDRGLLELHLAGSASFYTLSPALAADRGELDRGELGADRGELDADRGELGADRGELDADRGELNADRGELPEPVRALVAELGVRPRKEPLRRALRALCGLRPFSAGELAAIIGMRADKLVERHLSPMVEQGLLERTFPETPQHPQQAYRAVRLPLFGTDAG